MTSSTKQAEFFRSEVLPTFSFQDMLPTNIMYMDNGLTRVYTFKIQKEFLVTNN